MTNQEFIAIKEKKQMKFTVEKVIRLRQQLASFYILIQKKNYFIDIIYIQILYIYIHIQIYTYIYTNTQTDRQADRQADI